MTTAIAWLLIQVYPVVEPKMLTDKAVTCVVIANRLIEEDDNRILKCIPIELLVEEI